MTELWRAPAVPLAAQAELEWQGVGLGPGHLVTTA